MAYISTCSEMPDVQTAEEVLDWLTEGIRSGEVVVSFAILDREELEKLTVLPNASGKTVPEIMNILKHRITARR